MTTKPFEEFMSEINSINIEEALANAKKSIEAFEARDIIKQQQETINRQKAEIERLQIKIEGVQEANAILREHIRKAVKEFWEELKKRNTMDERIVSVASGDSLVKEMVGAESG